jgi:hypothetical protein
MIEGIANKIIHESNMIDEVTSFVNIITAYKHIDKKILFEVIKTNNFLINYNPVLYQMLKLYSEGNEFHVCIGIEKRIYNACVNFDKNFYL